MSDSESASIDLSDNELLRELKTRARLRLRALHAGDEAVLRYSLWLTKRRRWPEPAQWQLRHALNVVASECGFRSYESARVYLSGAAKAGDDLGGFWYASRCELLLNHWFASYADAAAFQQQSAERWLFPYGKQFVVGNRDYVETLPMDPSLPAWQRVERDLARCYASADWLNLCSARLQATRGLPPPTPGQF